MGVTFQKRLSQIVTLLLCMAIVLSFLLPFPKRISSAEEEVICIWKDGSKTSESYVSALASFCGIEEDGILLRRGELEGKVALSEKAKSLVSALNGAPLADLLSLSGEGLSRFEHAAIFRAFEDTLFYDGDCFAWSGERLVRTELRNAKKVVLLSGKLPKGLLAQTGAEYLRLDEYAELTAAALTGSQVVAIKANAPYEAVENAVYRNTPTGTRLIAALPQTEALVIENCSFIDEGALSACTNLKSLTLPFVGNTKYCNSLSFRGEIAALFGTDEEGRYYVPSTLERVTVCGGKLVSYAFYGCASVKEVNVCGLPWQDIARTAFLGLRLSTLHCPRSDVQLTGAYESEYLPCGCTLFTQRLG